MKNLALIVCLAACIAFAGCATQSGERDKLGGAVTSLEVTHNTVRSAAIAVKSLCEEGMISPEDCELARQAWESYREAEAGLKSAIAGYAVTKDDRSEARLSDAINNFMDAALHWAEVYAKVQATVTAAGEGESDGTK